MNSGVRQGCATKMCSQKKRFVRTPFFDIFFKICPVRIVFLGRGSCVLIGIAQNGHFRAVWPVALRKHGSQSRSQCLKKQFSEKTIVLPETKLETKSQPRGLRASCIVAEN